MFSIYTSAYKLNNNLFDWQNAIKRFSSFAEEVVVATNSNYDYALLASHFNYDHKVRIVNADISFDDYAFDGKLKNAALEKCTQPFCILLDLDEIIPLSTKSRWVNATTRLSPEFYVNKIDGLLVASVNLCGSELCYKDIGFKFYLHKNNVGIRRGVVDFAKLPNGKIDINRSDTTEPIYENGSLARFAPLSNSLEKIKSDNLPYVLHYWGVDKNRRIEQNNFWNPHWKNRAGREVENEYKKLEDFSNIPTYEHGLPLE